MNRLNNNSLARPTVCWGLAAVVCFFGLLFAGASMAMSAHCENSGLIGSASPNHSMPHFSMDGGMGSAHSTHKMASAGSMHNAGAQSGDCEGSDCKQSAECELSCAVGGGCVSPSVGCISNSPIDLPSSHAEHQRSALPSAFVSLQADTLYRPPIQ